MPSLDETTVAAIRTWAASEPLVRTVWAFGSRIRGIDKDGNLMRPDSDLDLAVCMDQPALAPQDGSEDVAFQKEWVALRLRGQESLARSISWRLDFEAHEDDASPRVKAAVEECSQLVYQRPGV